jgi:hypothetical protein
MPNLPPLAPVFAADTDAVIAVIVALVTIVGWIANLVSNKNQKGPPVANRPRPPARPRDDRLQQEINIFIEEAGAQRPRSAPPKQAPRSVSGGQRAPAPGKGRSSAVPAKKPALRPRPGQDIARRQTPVSETLGTGVKQHLSQHMTEHVGKETQQRLVSRVEGTVEQDLGPAMTGGLAARPQSPSSQSPSAPAPVADRAAGFATLLRNPATVQQAIVASLILSPPVARRQSGR